MSKIFFYNKFDGIRKSEAIPPSENASQRLTINISLAEGGTGKFIGPVEATIDTGNDGFLLIPKQVIEELGLSPKLVSGEEFEQADGTFATAPIFSLDVQIPTESGKVTFMEVSVTVTEEGSSILVGQGILEAFSYQVHGNKLTVFKLRNEAENQLEPWTPQASQAKNISAAISNLLKDSSIIEPIESKKPDLEVPSIANDFRIPKN